jgi:carbamoyl-phosphate synthase large subunit
MSSEGSILVSSAGRRVELIQCLQESITQLRLNLDVLCTDACPQWSPACQVFNDFRKISRCTSASYIDELLDICVQGGVRLIVPTIDTELLVLSENIQKFNTIGVDVIVSDQATIQLVRNKFDFISHCSVERISVPRTLGIHAKTIEELKLPIIGKPKGGSNSKDLLFIDEYDPSERRQILGDFLYQERWIGKEYTVNGYVSRKGQLIALVPHERMEVRGGEVSKGATRQLQVAEDVGMRLVKSIPGLRGPFNFQMILCSDGSYAVFELNARLGGGYPLTHKAGAVFTEWMLREYVRNEPIEPFNGWKSEVTMLRYDTSVFK